VLSSANSDAIDNKYSTAIILRMDMKTFLNTHSESEVQSLAEKVGSKMVYFKQIASGFRRPSKILSMSIEMASDGKITAVELRPDLDKSGESRCRGSI
jgi:DNA-binding transcriptional regulator YdaS (Cro superfamily)